MNIDWEYVQDYEKGGRNTEDPIVTIGKHGTINLSAGFVENAAEQMKNTKFALLSYYKKDGDEAIIIEFTDNSGKPGAMKITLQGKTARISGANFFRNYKIDYMEKRKKHLASLTNSPKKGKVWVVRI